MSKQKQKISFIGCGAIGQILANNIFLHEKFRGVELNFLDKNGGGAQALALKLNNSRFLLDNPDFSCSFNTTSNYPSISDSNIIIVTAGLPRRPDMKREDLLATNGRIISEVATNIKIYAPNALVIVVTNPLDQMVYLMSHILWHGKKVLGMTCIDGGRFLNYVSQRSSVQPFKGYVIGSHSDKMLVDWESLKDTKGNIISLSQKDRTDIEKLTIESGTRINQLAGRSDEVGTANSILAMINKLLEGKTVVASTNLRNQNIPVSLGKLQIDTDIFSAVPLKLIGDSIKVDKKYLSNINPSLGSRFQEALSHTQETNKNLLTLV